MTEHKRVFLKAKEEKELLQGFPWVFDNEIDFIRIDTKDSTGKKITIQASLSDTTLPQGTLVDVCSKAGQYLGTGILNLTSKISVRLISKKNIENGLPIQFDTKFFVKRLEDALALRKPFFSEEDSFRLVFAEADFFPGLIVELYRDSNQKVVLVVQFLALATEVFREIIIEALKIVIEPDYIYERSDASVRNLEGLEEKKGWIFGSYETKIIIKENDVLLEVDIENGQKTGYFLDQKFNRKQACLFAQNKKVLDTCTHTGAFGLNCVKAGAKEVIAVDISPEAIETVEHNIALNNAQKTMKTLCGDVFEVLKQYEKNNEKFDMIILDPPAFTKSAKAVQKAYGGYKEINLRAMKILEKGGILVTCSCSHFFDENTFYAMLMNAAQDAHRTIQILEKRGAAPDHPVLVGYPKSEYLKCAILRVL